MSGKDGYNRCPTCGEEMPARPRSPDGDLLRGQPRVHCCRDCSTLTARLAEVAVLMDKIVARVSSQARPRTLTRFRRKLRHMADEVGP